MSTHRHLLALVTPVVVAAATMTVSAPPASGALDPGRRHAESPQVVLDWERITMQTVYPVTPIPNGVPLLGFTALAVHDAVDASLCRARSSETAAVAQAAHDVLVHHFPASAATLDTHLATSLASVSDPVARERGSDVGEAAAAAMLASREGDGYGDPSIHYTLTPGIGIWQPVPPATDMLAAWLGSLDPLVVHHPVWVNGPDALPSDDYADDFREVKRLGGDDVTGSKRTQRQTDTALFFNTNAAVYLADALVRRLESGAEDLTLRQTSLLFARIHAAQTDSVIQAWRLKRDVGFWRPNAAIAAAGDDTNDDTTPQDGWASLLPTPPYSDYVSGHASVTAPAAEVIRRTLGDRTTLELVSTNSPTTRTYRRLHVLERDAFHSRIWGGLHFRDAMVDGYRIGHRTAARVMERIR
jgi:hypothetical protein